MEVQPANLRHVLQWPKQIHRECELTFEPLWFVLSVFFTQKQLGRYKQRMISKEE